jgi:outer membrane immunogenic protein
MNRLHFATAAVFSAFAVITPALADEAPAEPVKHVRHVERAPAPVRAAPVRTAAAQPSWTGTQVGGQGGVGSMAQGFAEPGSHLYPDCTIFPTSYCSEMPFSFNGNRTLATGGGFLGYRLQLGKTVVGVEGDINGNSGSSSYSASDANTYRAESFTGSVKQGFDGSIRGRLGFLVTPETLIYGTGGLAFGSVTGSYAYSAHEIDGGGFASATGGGSWTTTRTGMTGGAGVETMLTQVLTLRLEYRYSDFGRFSETVPLSTVCGGTCTSPSSGASINLHPTFQTVRVGLGYNF